MQRSAESPAPEPSSAVQRHGLVRPGQRPDDVGVDTAMQHHLRDRRRDDVDRVLAGAGARIQHDGAARAALAGLRVRLAQVHSHCDHVADRDWAEYRARLDAGLGELGLERARSAGDPVTSTASPDSPLFPLVTRLELEGWRVRLAALADQHTAPGPAPIEPLIAYVDRELDSYLMPGGATRDRRDDIRRVLDTAAARAVDPSS
jgi:hypothetical protein